MQKNFWKDPQETSTVGINGLGKEMSHVKNMAWGLDYQPLCSWAVNPGKRLHPTEPQFLQL